MEILPKHGKNTGNLVCSSCKFPDSKGKRYFDTCSENSHFFFNQICLPNQFGVQGCQFSDFSLISDFLRIKKTCIKLIKSGQNIDQFSIVSKDRLDNGKGLV